MEQTTDELKFNQISFETKLYYFLSSYFYESYFYELEQKNQYEKYQLEISKIEVKKENYKQNFKQAINLITNILEQIQNSNLKNSYKANLITLMRTSFESNFNKYWQYKTNHLPYFLTTKEDGVLLTLDQKKVLKVISTLVSLWIKLTSAKNDNLNYIIIWNNVKNSLSECLEFLQSENINKSIEKTKICSK